MSEHIGTCEMPKGTDNASSGDLEKGMPRESDRQNWETETAQELADVMWESYGTSKDLEELDKALSATRDAIELAEDPDDALRDLGVMLQERFVRLGHRSDVDEAISLFHHAIGRSSDASPDYLDRLDDLSSALASRYARLNDVADLHAIISVKHRILELMSDDSPYRPFVQMNLASFLKKRYRLVGNSDDRELAISLERLAIHLTPTGEPDLPIRLNTLGVTLHQRFRQLGSLEDLEGAILAARRALDLTPESHPHRSLRLSNLCSFLHSRFEHTGDCSDIEDAVRLGQHAVELVPNDHPHKPTLLNGLGTSLQYRFERLDSVEDLQSGISAMQLAVELTPEGHDDRILWLQSLGSSFHRRFERFGVLEDLEKAILAKQKAVSLMPEDYDEASRHLHSLGISLHSRFKRTGKLQDLDSAISIAHRTVEMTPDGHIDKPSHLNSLSACLQDRFDRRGILTDLNSAVLALDGAVELTTDNHTNKPLWQTNLCVLLLSSFEHTSNLHDLESAISVARRALELTPDGDLDKPLRLNNLSVSYYSRFERLGELQDLESAIPALRRAVELTPDDHPDKALRLNTLGSSLIMRFERLNDINDLESAISVQSRSVGLTPDNHGSKPRRLDSLGGALLRRFERTNELEDLERAILLQQRAAELTSDDHLDKPRFLHSLGVSLYNRYKGIGSFESIESAILTADRAVVLTPESHSHKPLRLSALAMCLSGHFLQRRELLQLERAILAQRHAILLTPDGHPDKPTWIINLGTFLHSRYEALQNRSDFEEAIECLMSATKHPLGSPSIRLRSSIRCVSMLMSDSGKSLPNETLLLAHSRVVDVLPEVAWLGYNVTRRYDESSEFGELVTAAVATAIRLGELPQAVEWLEAGRSLVWTQILSLRTPSEELEISHPELARSFRQAQDQLRQSVHLPHSLDSLQTNVKGAIPGVMTDTVAEHYRHNVLEYERLLSEVRSCEGFGDFLRPKKLSAILSSPVPRELEPVVFVNVHDSRCDALVLLHGRDVKHVELPALSRQRANRLRSIWRECLSACGIRARAVLPPWGVRGVRGGATSFALVLERLWTWIVSPVLKVLGHDISKIPEFGCLPRITWCPTGSLTQLPLHAAGVYTDPSGPRAYNFVVSSYTPSLSGLIRSHDGCNKRPTPEVLLVTQPATPGLPRLPGTTDEGARLQHLLSTTEVSSLVLDGKQATVEAVRAVVDRYAWLHFACHGSQDRNDATQSAFALYDGPLSLALLMGTVAENAELAFLSACQTAVGDEKIPEESAHLAAGMLAVGFKGVVATMWSIKDADAPVVVEAYYRSLLELRKSNAARPGETGAAYALHEAVRCLRDKCGERSFERWVPFVHFGV